MDEHDLARLTRPLVAHPPVPPAPVADLERRAARRSRRRGAALAVAVVLLLAAGGTALARAGRETSSERLGTTTPTTAAPQPDLRIYLDADGRPTEQAATVQAALLADTQVVGLTYQDQAGAYREFRCLFADEPDLVRSGEADRLPPSFLVDVAGGQAAIDRVAFALGRSPSLASMRAATGSPDARRGHHHLVGVRLARPSRPAVLQGLARPARGAQPGARPAAGR